MAAANEDEAGVIFSSVLLATNGMVQISYSEPNDREDDIVTWRTTEAHAGEFLDEYEQFVSALGLLLDAILVAKRDRAKASAAAEVGGQ